MASKKMTHEQMAEKLASLQEGTRVLQDGKTYTVVFAKDFGGKLCRRDIGLLEDGKPATYFVPGKYLAAGTVIERSNVEHRTLYAQVSFMNFEVVA